MLFCVVLFCVVLYFNYSFVVLDYSVEREHGGLRRIAGYGVTVTRGAASAMMFTFSSLLVTMCRNLITFLRETFVGHYVPFDSNVLFHKYIAFWALFFTGKLIRCRFRKKMIFYVIVVSVHSEKMSLDVFY